MVKKLVIPHICIEERQPTRFHDEKNHYHVGQVWVDNFKNVYMCTDNTNNNAIWEQIVDSNIVTYICENYKFETPGHIFIKYFTDPITITLPDNPTIGQVCLITDVSINQYQAQYRVQSLNYNINGTANYININYDAMESQFVFIGSDIGWKYTISNPTDDYNINFGTIITDNLTLTNDKSLSRYLISGNKSLNVVLPANPPIGTEFTFLDISGDLDDRPLIFNFTQGTKFEYQVISQLKYTEPYGYAVLRYVNDDIGWSIFRINDFKIVNTPIPQPIWTSATQQLITSGSEIIGYDDNKNIYNMPYKYLKIKYFDGGTF